MGFGRRVRTHIGEADATLNMNNVHQNKKQDWKNSLKPGTSQQLSRVARTTRPGRSDAKTIMMSRACNRNRVGEKKKKLNYQSQKKQKRVRADRCRCKYGARWTRQGGCITRVGEIQNSNNKLGRQKPKKMWWWVLALDSSNLPWRCQCWCSIQVEVGIFRSVCTYY